jgi:hypothetical protein
MADIAHGREQAMRSGEQALMNATVEERHRQATLERRANQALARKRRSTGAETRRRWRWSFLGPRRNEAPVQVSTGTGRSARP